MNTQTSTPRTDAQDFMLTEGRLGHTETGVDVDFARTLERELAEKDAQIVALRDALGTLSKAAETCIDYCYSDGSVHHQTFDTKAIGTAILASRSTLSTPPPPVVPLEDVKPLVEALRAISKQKLSKELDTDEHQSADFEYGYDSCVEQSREALTTFTAKHPIN